jgi:hypothetical protein
VTAPLIADVVNDIAAAGFRKASQGWHQHGKPVHPLDVQDLAVIAIRSRGERATVGVVDAIKRELAKAWPVTVEPAQAPAPTSQTLAAEAALWVDRFSMHTLTRDAKGWHLDGRPITLASVRRMAAGWAVAVAEAHGLGADHAPDARAVLADLRRLVAGEGRLTSR